MPEKTDQLSEAQDEVKVNFLKKGDTANGNIIANDSSKEVHPIADGGARAWLVMVGSFFCNGILFGVINSYGVLYDEYLNIVRTLGVQNSPGKAALAGSLAMGTTFFMSPISGILTDLIGIRKTAFIGGLIASGGMFLSSLCTQSITAFCFTYGIMYGLGGSLAYTPSLAVLGHYFEKHLGIVNGIVTFGSSVFTIAMPYVLSKSLQNFGLVWTLRMLALLAGFIMLFAIMFKPVKKTISIRKVSLRDIFNLSVLTNTKYIIWIIVIGFCLFGYFVPYVYMIRFVKENFPKDENQYLPIMFIGITSGISRLFFGILVDRTKVNRILLQQLAFFTLGILTILLPFSSNNINLLLTICLGMGVTDGCFISLLGPIAFDLCGRDGATQAIGFLLGVCSIPLTLGPYISGLIYEVQGSYTLPFLLAGVNPAVGSFGMLAIYYIVKRERRSRRVFEESAAREPLNYGKGEVSLTGSVQNHEVTR